MWHVGRIRPSEHPPPVGGEGENKTTDAQYRLDPPTSLKLRGAGSMALGDDGSVKNSRLRAVGKY
jgi:hypothetical protein